MEIELGTLELSPEALQAIGWVQGWPEDVDLPEEEVERFLAQSICDLLNDAVDDWALEQEEKAWRLARDEARDKDSLPF